MLVAARVFGHLAEVINLPTSVGQIMGGVTVAIAGDAFASYIPFLDEISASPSVAGAGEAGMFFLLLYAGIEMDPDEIASHRGESFVVAVGGAVVPLATGFALAWYVLPESDVRSIQAFVVGVALSITAIAVSAKVFQDFDLMHHSIGRIAISAAVIDDIIGLVLLGVVISIIATGSLPSIYFMSIMLGKVAVFFGVTWLLSHRLSTPLWRMVDKVRMPEVHRPGVRLLVLLTIALIYGLLAELLGLHFILGPFMAGLYFSTEHVGDKAYKNTDDTVSTVTKSVLGPLFFASIGLTVDLSALIEVPGFMLALLAVAIGGKLIGCGVPAYFVNNHNIREAAAIGIGMSGRGAMELFILSVAYQAGLFSLGDGYHPVLENLYSALVLTAIFTTALTPILLRWVLRHLKQ